MAQAAKKRLNPWLKNFPLWFRDHVRLGAVPHNYAYSGQPTSLFDKLPMLGRISGKAKERQPKPDHPVIAKILKDFDPKGEPFVQVNKMCGANLEAAYDSVARFASLRPLYAHDEKAAELALSTLREMLDPILRESKMCTLDEAIVDSELEKNPGLPWSRKYASKKEVVLHERSTLYRMWDELAEGEVNFWIDWALKQEMRNVLKIKQNKLRTIAMMSVDHILFSKMFMLDISQKLIASGYVKTGIAFGFNPFGGGMQRFARYLGGVKGGKGWEFDVSKMDANLHQWIIQRIADLLFSFLKKEHQTPSMKQRWDNLVAALCMCPVVLPDGTVWLKGESGFGGNPSGQFLTSIMNSLYSKFLLIYGFIKLGKYEQNTEAKILHEMRVHVRDAIVGDDLTYTTDLEWFNGRDYGALLYRDFGVVLETPDEEARHWYKLGFLGFKFHWSAELAMIVFKLRPNNVYSAVLTIGKGELDPNTGLPKPWKTLDRLCSLRLASWGDERTRAMVRYVIDKFVNYYDEDLYDPSGESEWEQAKHKIWSDKVIERLYTNYSSTDEMASSNAGAMAISWLQNTASVGVF